jgi:cation diffusion facilitator family transporter
MTALSGAGTAGAQTSDARYRQIGRVTWIGALSNVALAAVKVVTGWIAHSQALIADGIHSLSDLVSDAVVLLAARHATRDADADHPYGHGRIETAATILVGILLLATAALLANNALDALGAGDFTTPGVIALAVAVASVAAKEALFRYTRRIARRVRSRLLEANAWHHRTDALSSIVVVVGLAGTLLGMVTLDVIGALVVAAMIAKVGIDLIAAPGLALNWLKEWRWRRAGQKAE